MSILSVKRVILLDRVMVRSLMTDALGLEGKQLSLKCHGSCLASDNITLSVVIAQRITKW